MIESNIKWVMIVVGALTCTMFYAVLYPHAALNSTFGASVEGALAEVVVRSWGMLVTLIGAILLYGAFVPACRILVLSIATISKIVFVALVVTLGNQYLDKASITIAFDSLASVIFLIYLVRHYMDSNKG